MASLCTALPFWLLAVAPLFGHGAVYAPPTSPSFPNPPKVGLPNPSTPPTYGGSPVTTPPGGPQGPSTPTAFPLEADPTRWTWWWQFHREPYLALKESLYLEDPVTQSDAFFGAALGERLRPSAEALERDVLPALLGVLARERAASLVSSALIALARIGDDLSPETRQRLAGTLQPFLRDPRREVAEAALLALGILGDEASAPLLLSMLDDSHSARALLTRAEVPLRMRALAAYALGLLGGESEREDVRRYAAHGISRWLAGGLPGSAAELEAACVLAFGLLALPDAEPDPDVAPSASDSRAGQIDLLTRILRDRRKSLLVRAQVPISLARLAAAPAEPAAAARIDAVRAELLDCLAPARREERGLVQSAVVALGQLHDDDADPGDARTRLALMEIDKAQSDLGARRLARIALAQGGARRGSGEAKGQDDVRRFLLRDLARGSSEERAWAALALGVLERGRRDRGDAPAGEVRDALRALASEAAAPDEVGVAAIALGLLGDGDARVLLERLLADERDDEARGFVALALGMIGARAAAPRLQALVDASLYRPLILREAATGLALMGVKETLPRLLAKLAETRALASQAALAESIGRVGDARALGALVGLLEDQDVPDSARAFAAVALGLVGDLDALSWSSPLALYGNHLSAPATLYDDLGLGVLNLL